MTRQEIEHIADKRYPTAKDIDASLTTMAERKGWIAGFTEGLTMNSWHSVADGDWPNEPKGDAKHTPFIVIGKDGSMVFAYFSYSVWREMEIHNFFNIGDCEVSADYWMEIPQLPEKGGI